MMYSPEGESDEVPGLRATAGEVTGELERAVRAEYKPKQGGARSVGDAEGAAQAIFAVSFRSPGRSAGHAGRSRSGRSYGAMLIDDAPVCVLSAAARDCQ